MQTIVHFGYFFTHVQVRHRCPRSHDRLPPPWPCAHPHKGHGRWRRRIRAHAVVSVARDAQGRCPAKCVKIHKIQSKAIKQGLIFLFQPLQHQLNDYNRYLVVVLMAALLKAEHTASIVVFAAAMVAATAVATAAPTAAVVVLKIVAAGVSGLASTGTRVIQVH